MTLAVRLMPTRVDAERAPHSLLRSMLLARWLAATITHACS